MPKKKPPLFSDREIAIASNKQLMAGMSRKDREHMAKLLANNPAHDDQKARRELRGIMGRMEKAGGYEMSHRRGIFGALKDLKDMLGGK